MANCISLIFPFLFTALPAQFTTSSSPPRSVESYVRPGPTPAKWVLLGYGDCAKPTKLFRVNRLSYMVIPRLACPASESFPVPEIVNLRILLVDIGYEDTCRKLVDASESSTEGFTLTRWPSPVFPAPADSIVLASFQRHRKDLEQLVRMVKLDKDLDFVGTSEVMRERSKAPPSRVNLYQDLLRAANVSIGLERRGKDEFEFITWGFGSTVGEEYSKGIAFLNHKPRHIANDLGRIRFDSKTRFIAYRHMSGNWYMFFRYTPD